MPDFKKMKEIAKHADAIYKQPGYGRKQWHDIVTQAREATGGDPQLMEFIMMYRPNDL